MTDASSQPAGAAPTSIGPYTILGELGRGGMGTVYRARDNRLRRDVALKVLPGDLDLTSTQLARFEHEARILAALNHPNIAAIFGIEEGTAGLRALVLEFVDGQSLASRIAQGRMALDEMLDIARQIAQALEAAHEKGVVHRDLKPANIVVTPSGLVKVLDFGIATMAHAVDADGDTLTAGLTHTGMVVGTPAYMSPEQARGHAVDKRTDIWAFGCVLYETLTGQRPFRGDNASDTVAAVLTADPDWSLLPAQVPAAIRALLKRCLERERAKRLADVAAVRFALEDVVVSPATGASVKGRPAWALAAIGVLAATLAGVWIVARERDHEPRSPWRLDVDLGSEAVYGEFSTLAVSPDETRIVFPVHSAGRQMLGTRLLSESEMTVLQKTENGRDPFFSPDGKWIGFFADGKLRKVPVGGGAVVDLCEAVSGRGASWAADGTIVASLNSFGGLFRIPENGGAPQIITTLADEETTHRWPQVLPGSGHVIFSSGNNGMVKKRVMILSATDGKARRLVEDAFYGRVLPSGELLYIQGGTLWGAPYNRQRGELAAGTPRKLLDDVVSDSFALSGQFDFSTKGLFVYRSGIPRTGEYPVNWLTKAGTTSALVSRPDEYLFPKFTPDGARLLLNGGGGPYIVDLATGSRLSPVRNAAAAMWMPDSRHLIVRRATPQDTFQVVFVRDDGTGDEQVIDERKRLSLSSVSRDGKLVFYTIRDDSLDVWRQTLDLTDPERPKVGKAQALLDSPANETNAELSPDGRWLAYASDETGAYEVHVRSFPDLGARTTVSANYGRIGPGIEWSRVRKELYFYDDGGYIHVVKYAVRGGAFVPEPPRIWSPTRIRTLQGGGAFDLHPDGDRFAVFPREAPSSDSGVRMTFLLNGVVNAP